MTAQKKTLVIGASEKPERYSNKAIRKLLQYGHPVEAIGARPGKVEGVQYGKELLDFQGIDTVTLYLNAKRQKDYYDYLLKLHPRRVIFNPGTENPELAHLLKAAGIQPVEACTLVLLSTQQY